MIFLIRNKPSEVLGVTNFVTFNNVHNAALSMWGKDLSEWSFAFTGQSYRPVSDLVKDSMITTLEKELNNLITPPTVHDRDNALNALMRKRACGDMPGEFIGVMNRCLKTKADIQKFIELCDRKDTKIGMGETPSSNPHTYDITIHNGTEILAEWRHHDLPT